MSDQFFRSFLDKLGKEVGINPAKLAALLIAESGRGPELKDINSKAKSKKGAEGAAQLMPGTAKAYGVKDRTNPYESAEGGAQYLADLKQDVAAYNLGPTKKRQYEKTGKKLPVETRKYVEKVGITETMEKPKMQPETYQEYYKHLPKTSKQANSTGEGGRYYSHPMTLLERVDTFLQDVFTSPPPPGTIALPYMISQDMLDQVQNPGLQEMI
jgi:hypothetical protein